MQVPHDCRLTYNPDTKRMYVHIFAWPYRHLHLNGFAGKVGYAQLLNDASEVPTKCDEWHSKQLGLPADTLTITLPQNKPNVAVPVVELFMKQ